MPKSSRIIILFSLVLVFYFFAVGVQAGSEHNTSGYAWSENIGWVSFNSTSDGSPINYGVNIDPATGNLSGYAWSEHIGWVSFNRADTGNPPAAPFNGGSGPIAQYNPATGRLTGWMRVLANGGGWDGWLRFQNASIDASGDWHSWAWSDMVVGWLSFNSADPGAGGSGYKVTTEGIQPPEAIDLQVAKGDYCSVPAHFFSWTYSDPDGDNQSQFQFQVDNNSNFSSPEVDRTFSGLSNPSPTTNNQTVIVATSPTPGQIGYGATYWWRVMVWDDNGMASDWIEGASFATELHRYPSIDFSWSPQEPSVGENVLFADQSTVYGGATKSSWFWTFENGSPATSIEQNPMIQLTAEGPKTITLQVTDSDGYTCLGSRGIDVTIALPGWKEVLPR